MNRLLADVEESRPIWLRLYCGWRAIRAFAAAITIVLETSPPLSLVAIKNLWTISSQIPITQGALLPLQLMLFSDHPFLLLHLISPLYNFANLLAILSLIDFLFSLFYCECVSVLSNVFDTVSPLFSPSMVMFLLVGFCRIYSLGNCSVIYYFKTCLST